MSKFYDHAKKFWKFEEALVHVACMSEKHKINSFEKIFQKFSKNFFLKIKRMNYSIKNFLIPRMSDQPWLSDGRLKKKISDAWKNRKKKNSPKNFPRGSPRPHHYIHRSTNHISRVFTNFRQITQFCHSTIYYRPDLNPLLNDLRI